MKYQFTSQELNKIRQFLIKELSNIIEDNQENLWGELQCNLRELNIPEGVDIPQIAPKIKMRSSMQIAKYAFPKFLKK